MSSAWFLTCSPSWGLSHVWTWCMHEDPGICSCSYPSGHWISYEHSWCSQKVLCLCTHLQLKFWPSITITHKQSYQFSTIQLLTIPFSSKPFAHHFWVNLAIWQFPTKNSHFVTIKPKIKNLSQLVYLQHYLQPLDSLYSSPPPWNPTGIQKNSNKHLRTGKAKSFGSYSFQLQRRNLVCFNHLLFRWGRFQEMEHFAHLKRCRS